MRASGKGRNIGIVGEAWSVGDENLTCGHRTQMRRTHTLRRDTWLGYIQATMLGHSARSAAPAVLLAMLGAIGCRAEPRGPGPAPAAEFLVAAGDSTFWVRSD